MDTFIPSKLFFLGAALIGAGVVVIMRDTENQLQKRSVWTEDDLPTINGDDKSETAKDA